MLYEGEIFRETKQVKAVLESDEAVFRYCSFESATLEGGNFDHVFISCEFRDIDFYSGLFNVALFSNCKFEGCTFRGTSFAGCRFTECKFSSCHFLEDNLSAPCVSTDTKLFACVAENCKGWNELFQDRLP